MFKFYKRIAAFCIKKLQKNSYLPSIMISLLQMRDLVTKKSFLIRKLLDHILHKLMPNIWVPLYTTIAFSDMPYAQCARNKEWQDKVRSFN